MALGACGDWNKRTFRKIGSLKEMGKWWREVWENVYRCRGTGGDVRTCVGVWEQVRESVGGGVGREVWGSVLRCARK